MASESTPASPPSEASEDPLVQYIVVRSDLDWPSGALMGQASHASIAALYEHGELPKTKEYLKQLKSMHTVVLAAKSEAVLQKTAAKLAEQKVPHYVWIEQPEGIASALATAPVNKSLARAGKWFGRLRMFK